METIIYWWAVFLGSLISGALIGLIPLLVGLKMEKKELAGIGFLCCVMGSFIWGLFLAIPCCIGFTVAILVLRRKKRSRTIPETGYYRTNVLNGGQNGSHEGCPWYHPGSPGDPPGCLWHREAGSFYQQEAGRTDHQDQWPQNP